MVLEDAQNRPTSGRGGDAAYFRPCVVYEGVAPSNNDGAISKRAKRRSDATRADTLCRGPYAPASPTKESKFLRQKLYPLGVK